ncbi:MAG: MBL fold metallo-hydrolase, partial [Rhabdaerophilum sp.]
MLRPLAVGPVALAGWLLVSALPALAEACLGPIARAPDGTPVSFAAVQNGEVRITYVGHSTFAIESPQGVMAATDYSDYFRPATLPTIVTMNHAHSSHFTYRPDPAIRHVLRGWAHEGRTPSFDIQERDMRVRNVPTNIRDGG